MSIVIHEVSHGLAADLMGDKTARLAGRLNLNPIKHIDMFGSIILPAFMLLSDTGLLFGWAKPVPYNPANFKNNRLGTIVVASAGIVANLLIAIAFGLLIKFSPSLGLNSTSFLVIASMISAINIVLAIFNLIPLPPLDGSKVLFSALPPRFKYIEYKLSKYSIILLFILIFFMWKYIYPNIVLVYNFITGGAVPII